MTLDYSCFLGGFYYYFFFWSVLFRIVVEFRFLHACVASSTPTRFDRNLIRHIFGLFDMSIGFRLCLFLHKPRVSIILYSSVYIFRSTFLSKTCLHPFSYVVIHTLLLDRTIVVRNWIFTRFERTLLELNRLFNAFISLFFFFLFSVEFLFDIHLFVLLVYSGIWTVLLYWFRNDLCGYGFGQWSVTYFPKRRVFLYAVLIIFFF